ncbi:unnamed protein product [Pedinophyceae sp. YPF-701]|nr:unnamed protein product [Pedinophyceae sp. YPF-701]
MRAEAGRMLRWALLALVLALMALGCAAETKYVGRDIPKPDFERMRREAEERGPRKPRMQGRHPGQGSNIDFNRVMAAMQLMSAINGQGSESEGPPGRATAANPFAGMFGGATHNALMRGAQVTGFSRAGLEWTAPPNSKLTHSPKIEPSQENTADETGRAVSLLIYDLSNGLAKHISKDILGTKIGGVYHTSVVIDNEPGEEGRTEYFYSFGVSNGLPGDTPFGKPMKEKPMGRTTATPEELETILERLGGEFREDNYDVITHNCNNFSQELLKRLPGLQQPDGAPAVVPKPIMRLPYVVQSSELGQMLVPMFKAMQEKLLGRDAAGAQADGGESSSQESDSEPEL